MANILYGKNVSEQIKNEVQNKIKQLKQIPTLSIIRVGNDSSQISYEKNAIKKMESFGINTTSIVFDESISEEEFINTIQELNVDTTINGILILRPLPKHLQKEKIINILSYTKDVDGMTAINIEKVMLNDNTAIAPCTPMAVLEILKFYNVDIVGKHVVIVNASVVVGKLLAMLLLNEKATITICNSKTENLESICKMADIVVFATGKPKMFNKNFIKENAVVIDVGINYDINGKLCGDCDFDDMLEKVGGITPVPGGVGAVTTAMLGKNLLKCLG